MFLRLEILGHYLEMGRTEATAETEPEVTIADRQYPMTVSTGPVGFRTIGPDEYLTEDDSGEHQTHHH